MKHLSLLCSVFLILFGTRTTMAQFNDIQLKYEKFTLDNGLDVILHKDSSDPTIALVTLFHVGSNREETGKTGFAHFFEHMAFNDSENVPRGANRKVIPEWGGSRNGGTWSDGTIYYEEVPKDALEKILWIDSDRLGYMINTVTKEALEREKQVVKNEKRQNYDNRPYGFTSEIIQKNLYPEGHPYSWTVIGSLPDLQAATLEDVKEFYSRFYGPNNATFVIAGDIDIPETKELVKKWFGEIKRGKEVKEMKPMPVSLEKDKILYFEDNFAKLPEIRWTLPTIHQNTKENVALEALSTLLTDGKESPLYKKIVTESKLAPDVASYQNGSELAGTFTISVRANAGINLQDVHNAIEQGLNDFAKKGVSEEDLQIIKAQTERRLYSQLEGTLGKARALAFGNEYANDPLAAKKEVQLVLNLTAQDIMDVFHKYVYRKNRVITNFVPKGEVALAQQSAIPAEVWQEKIVNDVASEEVSQGEEAVYEKTPSSFARTEPAFRELPQMRAPEIWESKSDKHPTLRAILNKEIPMVRFQFEFTGGKEIEPEGKEGIAEILADWMDEGTKRLSPAQFEKELEKLGANLYVSSSFDKFIIGGSCLSRNFEAVMALMREMIEEPRFETTDFERIKQAQLTQIEDAKSQATSIGFNAFMRLHYGNNEYGRSRLGTKASVESMEPEYAKELYTELKNNMPFGTLNIVGDVKPKQIEKVWKSFGLVEEKSENVRVIAVQQPTLYDVRRKKGIYFIDVPGSKQSVILIGKRNFRLQAEDFHKLNFATEILGGGSSGRLFQTLRIEKGYTYGASRGFIRMADEYPMYIATNVRANATQNSLHLIREMLQNYAATFGDEQTEITKGKIIKSLSRAFESQSDKLGILGEISRNGKPIDFIEKEQQDLLDMDTAAFKKWINTFVKEEDMLYLIVGDKATQLEEVRAFAGDQEVIELDIDGKPIRK